MFGLTAAEVALLLLWTVGVACAAIGTLSRRFTAREAVLALAIAVFLPVVGSAGAVALYATRRNAPRAPLVHGHGEPGAGR